jgi:GAF domain-containing protein
MAFGRRQCVEWYTGVDPKDKPRTIYKNAILKSIGVLSPSIFVGAIFLTGAPWWLPANSENQISTSLIEYIPILIGIVLIVTVSISLVYDRGLKKSNILASLLHDMVHKARDFYCRTLVILDDSKKKAIISIDDITESLCEKTKEYFKELKRTDKLGVAIRLANKNDKGEIVYKTIARAGLNQNRRTTSEDIPENRGIPACFKSRAFSGALICRNVKEAAEERLFTLTKNEKMYEKEVQSFIVVPLNYTNHEHNSMIGLLYITSPKANYFFDSRDVDHARALGDLIAIVVSQIVYSFEIVDGEEK